MNTNEYFKNLEEEVRKVYLIAEAAREKGIDPVAKVEVPLAMSMAEKVVRLISTIYPQMDGSGIAERILELEKEYGKLDSTVVFKIAEEVAKQKFCKFSSLFEAIDAGIRVGFAYNTLGVVSSPIEGFTKLKLAKTRDGKEYFVAYFSGPIRSAGTTASCLVLILIDYLRELFGYAKYDPTEEEIKRYISENYDYHERVTNLQYLPTEEEIEFLAKNLPIQISGEPTEKLEVSNYKNLERVETNNIRGGMCLIFSEGLAQKAAKGFRLLNHAKENGIKSTGFDFIKDYIELHERRNVGKIVDSSPIYIQDLVAGRPVFGHPSRSGAFRFRYGRGRVSGFSAASLHPATMAITDNFIATGTQLKIEKPTKGCAVTVCDSIDGPIVKLFSGSVRKIKSKEEAKKIYSDVEEIIYLGDILFPFSDLANRNYHLIKPGYVEEWWFLELKEKGFDEKTEEVLDYFNVTLEKAVEFSKKYKIPLYPQYTFYWTQISQEQFLGLINWLKNSFIRGKKIIFPYNKTEQEKFNLGKRALELIGIEHEVTIENVVLDPENSKSLLINLGVDAPVEGDILLRDFINVERFSLESEGSILEKINEISEFIIKDKAGEFIGARMGRPEKAKLRKLTGSPNVLFPVGSEGGRLRSINATLESGKIRSSFPLRYCRKCNKETIFNICERCNEKTEKRFYCTECKLIKDKPCKEHKNISYSTRELDINHYFNLAIQKLGLNRNEIPVLIKGVRGTSSEEHDIEHLAKGILRAMYNLQVNKDGTIRMDATELPLTYFKPKEIFVSIEKLKEIGYTEDIEGNLLESEEQILELMPHDILLPAAPESPDEKADDVFIRVANFVDDELEKIYGLDSFYNLKNKEDLVGQIGVCMAPHNCAGVICRFIGFSRTQSLLASPYMHAAIRRDCVYPNTNFIYIDNNEIKIDKIGEYVEGLIKKGNKTKKIDSFGTLRVNLDKEIYSFGINPFSKKLLKKKIKYFIKGQIPEGWVKIKTSTGREQVMTPGHKFLYLDKNNNLKSKRADEIKMGDRIALLKNFNNFGANIKKIFLPRFLSENVPLEKQIDIRVVEANYFFKEIIKKTGEKNLRNLLNLNDSFNNLSDWYNLVPLSHVKKLIDEKIISWDEIPKSAKLRSIFNNKLWELELNVSEDLMSILGYYSAEGYSRETKTVSQVCFRIMEYSQRKKLVNSIKDVFGLNPNLGEEKTKITICNKLVYYLFRYCFNSGAGAYQKRVPDIVYNVGDNLVKSYLSSYFDGDGTILYDKRKVVCFYSVSRSLLDGIALLSERFGIFGRFAKTKERLPGKKVLERYLELKKEPKKHILFHLIFSGKDFYEIVKILDPISSRKLKILKSIKFKEITKRRLKFENKLLNLENFGDVIVDVIKEVNFLNADENSYCFEVDWKSEADKNVLWGEQIINARCDGDEAAIMLLGDVLINFSRKFLPSHRGGTQDAPLVLNAKIDAGEVDEQILDLEVLWEYPLELYRKAETGIHSSKVKLPIIKTILKEGKNPFVNIGFTHDTSDFNDGVVCSSYKLLATMQEKVQHQMELVEKIRAADTSDTARLIIERHFIRDMRGNLRKFSMQGFRCVNCNESLRRPPLTGVCPACGGKIIFTIHEGGIKKYLEPAMDLVNRYNLSPYIRQSLELTRRYIDSVFGKELEKQEALKRWF